MRVRPPSWLRDGTRPSRPWSPARNLAGGLVAASNLQREALVLDDERGGVAGVELVVEDGPRERRLERLGHEALERPRAVGGVEAAQRQLLDGVGFDLRVFAHMFRRVPVDASGRVSRRDPPTATPGAWR